MPSDLGVGDSETVTLNVAPADNTTSATLTATTPGGTSSSVTVAGGALAEIPGSNPVEYTQTWTSTTPVTFTQAGRWVLRWVVTGTGGGAEDFERYVLPARTAGGPTWWPGRTQVAAYVPWLTVSLSKPGDQTYQGTFSDDTSPDGAVADRHIADAGALVAPLATVMPAALYELAGTVTALHAAASLAAAYARTDEDARRAENLLARAVTAYQRLTTAVDDAGVDADADEPILIANYPGCEPGYLFF
ncbi:hypothetical protein GCM10010172_06720 [Paractinoplanes ferrugineus]|uniref:Uncharacterized protein n=1 Tax=Paractinoplanes ferrugineus TaxID=113564 RepID=A0A919J838_9ACTN|nr:hypothetical protein [Actinoplanes ferrugineus]GIE16300.1 hypothetical protein Afe05nite_81400 [Actinoplanes ferrugineus]